MKKALSLVLAVVLVLSVASVAVFAAPAASDIVISGGTTGVDRNAPAGGLSITITNNHATDATGTGTVTVTAGSGNLSMLTTATVAVPVVDGVGTPPNFQTVALPLDPAWTGWASLLPGQSYSFNVTYTDGAISQTGTVSITIAPETSKGLVTAPMGAYDEDGEFVKSNGGTIFSGAVYQAGNVTFDGMLPGENFYIQLGTTANDQLSVIDPTTTPKKEVRAYDLANDKLFSLKTSKSGESEGKSIIKKVSIVTDKKLGNMPRGTYLYVELNDNFTVKDKKGIVDLTFKAKKNTADLEVKKDYTAGSNFAAGDTVELRLTFWFNNTKVGNDGNPDAGDRVYFDPAKNDTNTLVWGDDRAALKFESDDSAGDFYCRLNTSVIGDMYREYGDPAGADLWFYTFVSSPTVPSTSRATLTLGIPWDDDDDYVPNVDDVFIYQWDGTDLTDVTDSFTYSDDAQEIPGWSIKTRTLGTYVISDVELDVDDAADDVAAPVGDAPKQEEGKVIANTGC